MLPPPEPALQARSARLANIIADEISDNAGWIGFDRYMHLALYHPSLGYYRSSLKKIGAGGDFITAPALGDLFARCIAAQTAEALEITGTTDIIEFGAGTGALARDILLELGSHDRLPGRYCIVETSAELSGCQRNLCDDLPIHIRSRIEWLETVPSRINGVVVANELLDALPCKRFVVDSQGHVRELGVSFGNDRFQWAIGAIIDGAIEDVIPGSLAAGYQSELPLQASAWMNTIGRALESGMILIFDYGFPGREFYHPDRSQGTLMCHYRHQVHSDPFFWPGLQDITSHIDFSAIVQTAVIAGLEVSGYCDQANFLISCGLLDLVTEAIQDGGLETREMLEMTAQVKKLTMAHEMGELFKVIALTKNCPSSLQGFSRRNLKHRLYND